MHTIYRLDAYDFSSNNYNVGRAEEYRFVVHKQTKTYEEAEKEVLQLSRVLPDAIVLREHVQGEENIEKFMKEFCFNDDKYMRYRKYFIDYVPKKQLKKALNAVGINVICNKY